MSKIIAISTGLADNYNHLRCTYTDAVYREGCVPLVVPYSDDSARLDRMLSRADMLLLTGGDDVSPERYGQTLLGDCVHVDERRDAYEWQLLRLAVERKLPVLGICRGLQVINVFLGGTLYQDLPAQWDGGSLLAHKQQEPRNVRTHRVGFRPGSRMAELWGAGQMMVNSFHHQAVRTLGDGLVMSASSPDGVCEALEHAELPIGAVQWHPEDLDDHFISRFLLLYASSCI